MQVKHKFRLIWRVFNDALLGFVNRLALGVTCAVCHALDVGIDGDKVSTFVIFWPTKGSIEDHIGSFAANAG